MARSSHASSNQRPQMNNSVSDQFGPENTRNEPKQHQQQPPNAENGQQAKNKSYPPKGNGSDQQLVNSNLSQQQFQQHPTYQQMPPQQYQPRGMAARPMIGHQQQFPGYMNMPMGPPGQPYPHASRPEMISHQPVGFYSGPPGAIVPPPMGRGPNGQQIVNNPEMQRQQLQQQQPQQNGMPRGQAPQQIIGQQVPQLSETRGSTQFSNSTQQQPAQSQRDPQQTQHLENYQVYRILPLYKALSDAMEEMGIDKRKQEMIIQKYDRSIEEEFNSEKFSQNNYAQNYPRIAGVGEKRVKFDSQCEYYNNVEQVWKFSIKDFKIEYEDKAQMSGNDVSLWSVPHYEHRLRPQKRSKPQK